jgi:P-type E1-E2 ATPase
VRPISLSIGLVVASDLMLLSDDRESEVRYLAKEVGITEIHAQMSPEEKLAIVGKEAAATKTLYVGDGINHSPAMMAAQSARRSNRTAT